MNLPSQKLFFVFIPVIVALGLFVMFFKQPTTDNRQLTNGQATDGLATNNLKAVAVQNSIINTVDSDGDGVPDWEEALWGTDPHNPNTFGIPDKEYILQQMQKQQAKPSSAITSTEDLSRKLFTQYVSLQSSGQLTAQSIDAMTRDIVANINSQPVNALYTAKNIMTFPDSNTARVQTYALTITKLYQQYAESFVSQFPNISLVPENPSFTKNAGLLGDYYAKFAKELISIPVPAGAASLHLTYINAIQNAGVGLKDMQNMNSEPLNALLGLKKYLEAEDAQATAIVNLKNYLISNGIIGLTLNPF